MWMCRFWLVKVMDDGSARQSRFELIRIHETGVPLGAIKGSSVCECTDLGAPSESRQVLACTGEMKNNRTKILGYEQGTHLRANVGNIGADVETAVE